VGRRDWVGGRDREEAAEEGRDFGGIHGGAAAGTDAHATHEIDARVRGFVHGEEPAHGHGRARAVLESGVDVFSVFFFKRYESYESIYGVISNVIPF
jgi:hypothetical protein